LSANRNSRDGLKWQFDVETDIVNQEFSFGGGRADVIATFDGRTNLAIVEAKPWIAGNSDVAQLT
jgi:hypothetical protein